MASREEAHALGRVLHDNAPRFVPREYRRFIGTVPDETLYKVVSNKNRISTSDVDRAVAASGGSGRMMSYLLGEVMKHGTRAILRKSTDDYIGSIGVGRAKLDALVAFGVEDRRVRLAPTTRTMRGLFEGTIDGREVSGHIEGSYTADSSVGRFA